MRYYKMLVCNILDSKLAIPLRYQAKFLTQDR